MPPAFCLSSAVVAGVDVTKDPSRVKERIGVQKDVETERQTVQDEVKKEHVDVEGDVAIGMLLFDRGVEAEQLENLQQGLFRLRWHKSNPNYD